MAQKKLRQYIFRACESNAKRDVFQMLINLNAYTPETELLKWLNDSSLCDHLNEQVEVECVRHGERAEEATSKERSRIAKG